MKNNSEHEILQSTGIHDDMVFDIERKCQELGLVAAFELAVQKRTCSAEGKGAVEGGKILGTQALGEHVATL